jgi:prepilin-type N-terminal cleavage/methylation domain-containing protein
MQAKKQQGFSLVEIAIVLVIVGLMVGGLLTPLTMQMEQRKAADTQRALDEAREALVGFAVRYGYLPCPAISASDGQEDRSGNRCTGERREGYLPWATLGLARLDAWSHLYRYSVTPAFADSANRFKLVTARDITVYTRDALGNLSAATAPSDIPAVILSHGRNGYGATSDVGLKLLNASRSNEDEQGNAAADISFMARNVSDNRALPGGEFDDMVAWVSPNILFNRMVAAQVLP